jgi:hypothetical protein
VAAEGINLVDHRVVGFSGKRKLNIPDRVRDKLREVLSALKVSLSGKLVAAGPIVIDQNTVEVTREHWPKLEQDAFPEGLDGPELEH